MTIAAAARYLKVSSDTIIRLHKQGKLRKLADGGINSEDLELVKLDWDERKKIGSAVWLHQGKTV